MISIGINYHCFPKYDEVMSMRIDIKQTSIIPEWQESDKLYFCVVAVSDLEVREFYSAVRKRRDFLVSLLKQTNMSWEICIKPIFRFSDVNVALQFQKNFDGMSEQDIYDIVSELLFEADEPWNFAQEILDFHIDKGGQIILVFK